jgi:hypothetical protein
MINKELLDYVAQQLRQGTSPDSIKNSLLENGWNEADVSEAFAAINAQSSFTQTEVVSPGQFSGGFQQSSQKPDNAPLIVVLVIFVMLVGAVGAALAFGVIRIFPDTPESVMKNMMIRLGDVTSFEYRGESKATMVTKVSPIATFDFFAEEPQQDAGAPQEVQEQTIVTTSTFRGASDHRNPDDMRMFFVTETESEVILDEGREEAQGALGDMEYKLGYETRFIDGVMYVKLTDAPRILFFDLSFLAGQWVRVDFDEVIKALEEHFGEIPEEYRHRVGEVREALEISPEEHEKLKNAFLRHNPITITETLPSESIEGVNSHRYRFTIEEEALIGFITDAIAILVPDSITQDEAIMNMDELRAGIEEFFANAEPMTGEIWIGKRDYLPRKVSLTLAVTMPDASELKSTTTVFYESFNEPVQIDVPSPTKGVVEFIQEAMQGMFGGLEGGFEINMSPGAGGAEFMPMR